MTHWPELINVPTYLQGTPATALLIWAQNTDSWKDLGCSHDSTLFIWLGLTPLASMAH